MFCNVRDKVVALADIWENMFETTHIKVFFELQQKDGEVSPVREHDD
jgi:hypothetical protein